MLVQDSTCLQIFVHLVIICISHHPPDATTVPDRPKILLANKVFHIPGQKVLDECLWMSVVDECSVKSTS